MKRIKLEVLVENRDAWETLKNFKEVDMDGIVEYTCSMEDVKECDGQN